MKVCFFVQLLSRNWVAHLDAVIEEGDLNIEDHLLAPLQSLLDQYKSAKTLSR